jgi:ABC-type multidrug transport system fused ATPase/permease subunit
MKRLISYIDSQQHAYFLTCAAQSWLAVRLELIGTLIITFACSSAVLEKSIYGADPTFAGLAGLAISYALMVTQSLNWSVRSASDLEANMVAVERVKEYTNIDCEGARHTSIDRDLPSDWPSLGQVEVRNAKMRYREELPLVLKGLNLNIPAGSKVGVVGRTGTSIRVRHRNPLLSLSLRSNELMISSKAPANLP